MDLLADLEARGLVHDTTDREALRARLAAGPISLYIGFDPTADSLHVGHLVGQLFMRRFQMAGHRPFPLAGGATGMIGTDLTGDGRPEMVLAAEFGPLRFFQSEGGTLRLEPTPGGGVTAVLDLPRP